MTLFNPTQKFFFLLLMVKTYIEELLSRYMFVYIISIVDLVSRHGPVYVINNREFLCTRAHVSLPLKNILSIYQMLFLICSDYRAYRIVYKSTCFPVLQKWAPKKEYKLLYFYIKCYSVHLLYEFKWLYFLEKSIWIRNSYCFIDNSICSIIWANQKQYLLKILLF